MENCTQVESTTTLHKPCLHGSDGGCVDVRNGDNSNNNNKDSLNRDSLQGGELMSVDQCQKIQKMDDSQLVGNADEAFGGDAGATMGTGVVNGVKVVEQTAGKRRRGRPPRSQGRSSSTGPPPTQRKTNDDEEDVCFICFDGGSLVLCDRRGCPKAYHPACIKREEAFFKSKAKWNCGWHICSTCQKASHYMCYTCTYSLCKNCTKGADYVNVRGNKGFCGMCMRTIMLIENSSLGNKEMVQVDFDDKTSWEYLFKVYWILLKEKLSLSLDELIKAKNPWKDTAIPKGEPSVELYNYTTGSKTEMSCGDLGAGNSKRRKTITQPKFLNRVESPEAGKLGVIKGMPLPEGTNWATKELLEFLAHMRNGDISMISRFDVQALLLEYITRSNLRDPHQKSYVVCDSRLRRLFGKGRVGHFEMLKLLDSHFIIQDHSRAIDTIRSESTDAVATQLAVDGNNDSQPVIANDKRRKTRKKVDEKGQLANPDEFAAVDVHNMNLIYLKRNLVENLIDDADKFNEKVIGSFVRIQVPCSDQKQDLYRLVLVTGISKVAEPYKLGERTINVMLEIVNLDRKEVISIDGISDQEFSEDECQRLQQSIKCRLIKWFTVGEILEKATALQAVRVNEWLESEILRVKNLRDRANEKGLTKELRECVEKLQLLNSPDERQRRLHEIPEVHCDPNMNLYCKSEDAVEELNEKRKGMNEKEPSFPQKGGDVLRDAGSREHSIPPHSAIMDPIVEISETDKIWHYQDPAGKIQGPFSMTMLRKWSEAGLFPSDLRIWRASGKQDNSMLLVDAMNSQYCQEQVLFHDSYVSNECARAGDINLNQMGDKKVEDSSNSKQNNTSDHYCGNSAPAKNKELCPQSSPSTSPVDAVNSNAVQRGSPLPQWDPVKGGNDLSDPPQDSSSLPSSAVPGKPYETPSHQVSEGRGVDKWDSGSIGTNENLNKTSDSQPIAGNVKQDDTEGKSGKTCGESWKCPPLNDSSNGWGSSPGLISLAKALEAAELNQDMNFPDLHTSKSELSGEDSKGQATESRQSVSSNVPHRDSGPSWSTTSSLVGSGPQLRELAGEWASSTSVKPSAEEWNSNLVPESSLKRTDLATDHAATSTSGSGHSSPPDPANNATGWDPIVPEPNEYSLGDESVSDLLAEVEAMESLNGLASPTSILHCDGAQGSEPDCFSPVGGLSSAAPDMGKSDALSSTNDLPMHSRSAVTIELFGLSQSQSEVLDAQKSSGGHSSPSAEMDEDARPSDISVNQYEAGSDIQHPAPPVTSWGMANVDTWRAGPQTAGTNWGAVQGNANFSWGGLGQGTMNVGYGVGQGTFQENGSYNSGSSAGNPSYWGNQQRYASPRERDFQVRDSSFGRGRSLWNRQSSYGGPPNGAASFRPPPKGQRVCKFYENGYCKKGASCSYWHP